MPTTVRAVGRDSIVTGIPDVAFVTLELPVRASLANVELSWLAPSKLRRTVIVGSEKMVVYDDGSAEPVRVFDHGVVYEDPETFGAVPALLPHRRHRLAEARQLRAARGRARGLRAARCDRRAARRRMPTLARNVVRLTEAAETSLEGGAEVARRRRLAAQALADGDVSDREPGAEQHVPSRAAAARTGRSGSAAEAARASRPPAPGRRPSGYGRRDYVLRAAARGGRLVGVVIAAASLTVLASRRERRTQHLAPGPRDAPGVVHRLQPLRPLRPRHQADQPLDASTTCPALPRAARRHACALWCYFKRARRPTAGPLPTASRSAAMVAMRRRARAARAPDRPIASSAPERVLLVGDGADGDRARPQDARPSRVRARADRRRRRRPRPTQALDDGVPTLGTLARSFASVVREHGDRPRRGLARRTSTRSSCSSCRPRCKRARRSRSACCRSCSTRWARRSRSTTSRA